MKPTLAMETKCNISDSSESTQHQHVAKPASSKWMRGVAVTMVSMVIVAGIVVGALFLGGHLTRAAHKESWVNYKTSDGLQTRERLTVGEDEEQVYIPGQYQALFDFKRSLFLLKDLSDSRGICYMTTFNTSLLPSPAELRALMTDAEIQSSDDVPAATIHMKPTSTGVSPDVLSATSRSMCTSIYWALPTEGCGEHRLREKRRIKWKVTINLLIFKIEFGNE